MPDPSYVLVVEDNQTVRNVLVELLTGAGLKVRTADDGPRALDMIAAELPGLMVLDLFLQTMDGWQVMERLRGIPTTTGLPVVAMSAGQVTPPPGVSAFVHKPFDIREFMTLVRRLVSRSGSRLL